MCTDPVFMINPILRKWYSGIVSTLIDGVWDHVKCAVFRDSKYSFSDFRKYFYSFRGFRTEQDLFDNFFCKLSDGRLVPIFFLAPCGKCHACQLAYASDLKARLALESLTYGDNDIPFITLTYRDECLPNDGVSRDDVQRFLKRLRKNLSVEEGMSSFMRPFYVSEYGTDPKKTRRPHYHLLLFGIDWSAHKSIVKFDRALRKSWKLGIVQWEMARDRVGCSKYVCKYVTKSVKRMDEVPEGKNPNFWCGPRKAGLGIGMLDYIKENFDYTKDTCVLVKRISSSGQTLTSKVKVPKYILDKICPPLSRHVTKRLIDTYGSMISHYGILSRLAPVLGYDLSTLNPPEHYAEYIEPFLPRNYFSFERRLAACYRQYETHFDKMELKGVRVLGSIPGGTTKDR